MLKERLNQINSRLGAIENEIRSASTAEVIEALRAEATSLIEERGRLTAQMGAEAIAAMNNAGNAVNENEEDIEIRSYSKRDKLALIVGRVARKKGFTDAEKRALGVALTTTASVFSAATGEADGVNNGGVTIPTSLVFDLLREDGKLSAILNDVNFTAIKGLTEFPYRKSRTAASAKAEGSGTGAASWEFDKLSGVKGWLQTKIVVTDELQALSDIDFGAYVADQMLQDMPEDFAADIIYGTGSNNHIKGVVTGVSAKTYTAGKELESIIAAIKAGTGRYFKNAKVYLASDVYKAVLFAVDANGNFKLPVLNNATGVTSLAKYKIEEDECLHDGDIVFGDVNKYYKANALIDLKLESQRNIDDGTTTYVAKEYCAAAGVTNAFVYYTKQK